MSTSISEFSASGLPLRAGITAPLSSRASGWAGVRISIGGGLIRSSGGWQAVKSMRRLRIHAKGDERILGESDFVLQVLKEHNEQLEKRTRIRSRGVDPQRTAARVEEIFGLTLNELSQGNHRRLVVRARSLLCY